MPARATKTARNSKPTQRSYSSIPSSRQVHFNPPRTTIRKRPCKSTSSSRQSTLTQADRLYPKEVMDSDEEILLDNVDDVAKLRDPPNAAIGSETTSKVQICGNTSSLTAASMARSRKRKAQDESGKDSQKNKLRRRRSEIVPVLAEDSDPSDKETTKVEHNSKAASKLASLLKAPQEDPQVALLASPSMAFKQSHIRKHPSRDIVRSSESPENSPESIRKVRYTAQHKDDGFSSRSPHRPRSPLGILSSNRQRRPILKIKSEPYIKEEPLTQPVALVKLPPIPIQTYDDDDLDARPLRASPSQNNINHIPSDIPWYIPSTPERRISGLDNSPSPDDPPQTTYRRDTHDIIADSEADGEDELETQYALPIPQPPVVKQPQPPQPQPASDDTNTVCSTATTQPPSSTPQAPPLDADPGPPVQDGGTKSFSQATTVDVTPRSQRYGVPRAAKSSQISRTQHPLSDPPLVSSSPPLRPPSRRVYKDIPGFGDVPVLTESQMLPESIMNFQLPAPADDFGMLLEGSQD